MVSEAAEHIYSLHQRRLASEALTCLLEDLAYGGAITHEQKENYYQQYSKEYGLTGLLHPKAKPKKADPLEAVLENLLSLAGANKMKSTIITREGGKKIPEDTVSALTKTYGEEFGYATVMTDNGVQKLIVGKALSPADLAEYLEICDTDMVIHLTAGISKTENDQQPYVLIKDDKDMPVLVCCIEGEFPDFHDGEAPETTQFLKDYLIPKIDTMFEMVDGDIGKLTTALQKESIGRDIMEKMGVRGCVTFLSNQGVSFAIEMNDKRKEYDWGELSIAEGDYPAAGDTQVPIKTGNPLLDKIAAKKAAAAAAAGKPDGVHATDSSKKQFVTAAETAKFNAEQAAKRAAATAPLKTDIDNATVLNGGATAVPAASQQVLVFPPKNRCKDKSSLNNWYNKGWGIVPQNSDAAITNYADAVGMPLATLKKSLLKDGQYQHRGTVAGPLQSTGNTQPAHIPTEAALPVATGTTAGGFPVIPAGQKEVVTGFLKTVDLKSIDITDPKLLADIEKRASTFFDQYPDTDPTQFILGCPLERLEELYLKWPESFKLLTYTLRHYAALHVQNMKKLQSKETTTHELAHEELKGLNPLQAKIAARNAARKTA